MSGKNALHLQFVLARQRRNFDALPGAAVKSPAVIAALQCLPIKAPIRKRYASMRARIAHRKRAPIACPPQHQRHFQQHRRRQLFSSNLFAPQRRIPKIPQKSCIRRSASLLLRFAIRKIRHFRRFTHRLCIVVHRAPPQQPRFTSQLLTERFGAILYK